MIKRNKSQKFSKRSLPSEGILIVFVTEHTITTKILTNANAPNGNSMHVEEEIVVGNASNNVNKTETNQNELASIFYTVGELTSSYEQLLSEIYSKLNQMHLNLDTSMSLDIESCDDISENAVQDIKDLATALGSRVPLSTDIQSLKQAEKPSSSLKQAVTRIKMDLESFRDRKTYATAQDDHALLLHGATFVKPIRGRGGVKTVKPKNKLQGDDGSKDI